MAWTDPFSPNLADYQSFLSEQGFSASVLPPSSPWIQWSFNRAISVVIPVCTPGPSFLGSPAGTGAPEYTIAVYNLATHHLVLMAQDQPGLSFFTDLRARLNTAGFIAGVVASSSDQGTSSTMLVPDAFKGFRIADLEYLKTIWGRAYLSYAQKAGPVVTVMV